MAFERRRFGAVLVHVFLCSILSAEVESDIITCLQSIKDSLEDPYDSLRTWDFNNKSVAYICQNFHGVMCMYEDQVTSIVIVSMGLKGQFPRSIENCSSLKRLYLSNNQLSGRIPSHISSMLPSLTELDLSYNKFSAEIPASIGNLTSLNILRLNNNEFIGEIPHQLGNLTLLTEFSVANNLLWGPVPVFSTNAGFVNKKSYLNNTGLCGGPLEPCNQFHQSFREGIIAGYVFSAISVIVVYLSYCVPWTELKKARRKKPVRVGPYYSYIRRKREKEQQKEENQMDKLHLDLPHERSQSLLHLYMQEISRFQSAAPRMSFVEVGKATDNFSVKNAIGMGKTGMMYKARLVNNCFIAVKRLYDSQLFKTQFNLELLILAGRYRHRNMVPLLGYCDERNERILVYKYMSNGRLHDWLCQNPSSLDWPVRLHVALRIAKGLYLLHYCSSNLQIVHCNISSECILLDQDFVPKISNFGNAKFIKQSIGDDLGMCSDVKNQNNGVDFVKKDVHDFGIVLFELIMGKRFNQNSNLAKSIDLTDDSSNCLDVIDRSIIGDRFEEEIFILYRVACDCLKSSPDQRPTMLEVYNRMRYVFQKQGVHNDHEKLKPNEIDSDIFGDGIVEL